MSLILHLEIQEIESFIPLQRKLGRVIKTIGNFRFVPAVNLETGEDGRSFFLREVFVELGIHLTQ